MQDVRFDRLTADARSLADRLGSQTAEALIRAASGTQQAATEGLSTATAGVAAVGAEVGQGISEGAQSLALPNTTARMAWRAGRYVGRVEGAVRLAAFGLRIWWKQRQRRGQKSNSSAWVRPLVQWGPTTVASAWMLAQIWTRVQHRETAA